MTIIAKTLEDYVHANNKEFSHDRANTVGASEVGQCARKIYWLKNENDSARRVERDGGYRETWGARMRGSMFEDHFWEPALRARFGKRLRFAGKQQVTFVNGFLSATPDALITELTEEEKSEFHTTADSVTAECKTSDPRANISQAKQSNVFQVVVQLGLIREMTTYKPDTCILSYTDASYWDEVKEFTINFDENIYKTAQDRATIIMTATHINEVKPEGWIAGGYECRYCPFTKACGIARHNLPFANEPVDEQFTAEITDLVSDLRSHETHRDSYDRQARGLRNEIKNRLREKGVRKIPNVLTWSPVKGRPSWNDKAIREAAKEAGVELEKFETIGEPTDRLVIHIGSSDDDQIEDRAFAAV